MSVSDPSSSCVRTWLPFLCPLQRVGREGDCSDTLGQLRRNPRQLTPCFVSPEMMIGCDYQVWIERKTLITCATTLTSPGNEPLTVISGFV